MVSLTAMIPLQQHFHKTLFIYRFIYLFTFYCLFMRYVFLPLFFHGVTIKLKPLRTQLHRAAFFAYSAGRNLRFLLNFLLMVKLFYG